MPKVVQRGLFTTHRGTIVKRAAITAAVLIGVLTIASNVSKGHAHESTGTAAAASSALAAQQSDGSTPADPVVASYIADPFSPQSSSFYEIGAGSTATDNSSTGTGSTTGSSDAGSAASSTDTGASATTDDGQPTPEPTVPNEAQAIKQAAQQFAPKWGTYSATETAAQFVGMLPNLAPGADKTITQSISGSWDHRFDKTKAFISSLSGAVPIVDSYDPVGGTARVSVAVDEEAVGSEDAQDITTRTFQIDLKRYTDSEGTLTWGVTRASGA